MFMSVKGTCMQVAKDTLSYEEVSSGVGKKPDQITLPTTGLALASNQSSIDPPKPGQVLAKANPNPLTLGVAHAKVVIKTDFC